jgi:hypothetical protein
LASRKAQGILHLVEAYQTAYPDNVHTVAPQVPWPRFEQEWFEIQCMDPTLQPVIDKLVNSQDKSNATHQCTRTKHLYLDSYLNPLGAALRLYEDKDGQGPGERSTSNDRIVVLATLVKQVIERCHDHRTYPGITATGANVNLRY